MRKSKLIGTILVACGMLLAGTMGKPVVSCAAGTELVKVGDSDSKSLIYTISNLTEFKNFVTLVNNGQKFKGVTVKLISDIVYDGTANNYTSINDFQGVFDGCGHSISGINQQISGEEEAGVFGKAATVKNLIVKDSTFQLTNIRQFGAVVGYCTGEIVNCHVKNVSLAMKNGSGGGRGYGCAGGVAGYAIAVRNCSVQNTKLITDGVEHIGGVVGEADDIYNSCYITPGNAGDPSIVGTITNAMYNNSIHHITVGGVAGAISNMQNCYSVAYIQNPADAYIGGIAGYADKIVSSNYCVANASVAGASLGYCEIPNSSNTIKTLSDMQSAAFVNQLNANIGDRKEWIRWEKRSESVYPLMVSGINLDNCTIALANTQVEYTGQEVKPGVSISYNGNVLVEGSDYDVQYVDNKDIGTATIFVTGRNWYMGAVSLNFQIAKKAPEVTYTKEYSRTYGSSGFYLTFKVKEGGKLSYKSSNSKVAAVNNNGYITVGQPGIATIVVTQDETDCCKGETYEVTVIVYPSAPVLRSLSTNKRKLNAKWSKCTGVTGYELQYSANKKFKKTSKIITINKNKPTKKIKKLKHGKKYYVRVRAYKKVGNARLYSVWSNKKCKRVR